MEKQEGAINTEMHFCNRCGQKFATEEEYLKHIGKPHPPKNEETVY